MITAYGLFFNRGNCVHGEKMLFVSNQYLFDDNNEFFVSVSFYFAEMFSLVILTWRERDIIV